MGLPRQVPNAPDLDPGRREVDQQLRQAFLAIARGPFRAEKTEHIGRLMGVCGPDLAPVEAPSARSGLGARPDGGEVGSCVRFAEADADRDLAPGQARQDRPLLVLCAQPQQERTGLTIARRMGSDGGADGHHLLENDIAFEHGSVLAAVGRGPGHADPAAGADRAGEVPVETDPGLGDRSGAPAGLMIRQKGANLQAERFRLRRQGGVGEVQRRRHQIAPLSRSVARAIGSRPSRLERTSCVCSPIRGGARR